MEAELPKECLSRIAMNIRPEERDALERLAGNRSVAAYIRDAVNSVEPGTFAPTVRGRRWEPNPEDRHLRKHTT
jgi:hypothetical protein